MSKERRIYVSFASQDNTEITSGEGWVDGFIRHLTVYVSKVNNQNLEIVPLDSKAKRPSKLENGEGLVLIVSGNYLEQKIQNLDAPLMADKNSVFKVDLEPISKSKQPKELRTLNEFYFFETSSGDAGVERLSNQSVSSNFWLKMIDLAFEINQKLFGSTVKSKGEPKKIYLAETSYDQVHKRDEIKRELIRYGHVVLPQSPFSNDLTELKKEINHCLEQCDLSVHIIGEEYGDIPEGSTKSIVEIQNELSNQHYSGKTSNELEELHRLIWMPLNVKPKSDQQKLYLDQLKDDIASTTGAEIIQTPLEILKTIIHTRLQMFDAAARVQRAKMRERSAEKLVYVLFDKKDEADIKPILDDIKSKKIQVLLPQFESKQIEFLEKHRESLVQSDGVLLFANSNLNWLNSKLNDVIKAPGFGKQFPFDAKAVLIKNSSIPKDKIPAIGDLIMLNGDGNSNKTEIGPFLDKIASS